MIDFKKKFTQIDNPENYSDLEYYFFNKDPSLIMCVEPPNTRMVRFSNYPHCDRDDFGVVSLTSPWKIYITPTRKNINSNLYSFTKDVYTFFSGVHPKRMTKKNCYVYSPWYPNLQTIFESNHNSLTNLLSLDDYDYDYEQRIYQYNCVNSTLDSLDDIIKDNRFSYKNNPIDLSLKISNFFQEYISSYYSGTFNCDLSPGSYLNHLSRRHNSIHYDGYDNPFDYHVKWFKSTWTLPSVCKQDFLKKHANPYYTFDLLYKKFIKGRYDFSH